VTVRRSAPRAIGEGCRAGRQRHVGSPAPWRCRHRRRTGTGPIARRARIGAQPPVESATTSSVRAARSRPRAGWRRAARGHARATEQPAGPRVRHDRPAASQTPGPERSREVTSTVPLPTGRLAQRAQPASVSRPQAAHASEPPSPAGHASTPVSSPEGPRHAADRAADLGPSIASISPDGITGHERDAGRRPAQRRRDSGYAWPRGVNTRTISSSTRDDNVLRRHHRTGPDLMDLQLVQHAGLERPLRGVPAEHVHVAIPGAAFACAIALAIHRSRRSPADSSRPTGRAAGDWAQVGTPCESPPQ
jgi:hypothetical protein